MEYIRKFYEADLKKVMKIWYESNLEAHDFVPQEYWDRNFGYVSRLIPRSEVYVYEINGVVAGFIGMDEGYINGLFVEKDSRGMGIGTKLLEYVYDIYDFLELDVFENNIGAIQFYEDHKFKKLREEVNEDLGEVEYRMYYKKPKQE